MNQYEKEIQALKYRCRKLEQQCSMFDDTFQKQNQLVKSQDEMIQILKERNHYLEEHIATLTKAYQVQEELCQTQELPTFPEHTALLF